MEAKVLSNFHATLRWIGRLRAFKPNSQRLNLRRNIVFSTLNKGMDKKSADKVVKEIIAIFEKGEEVDMKD